MKKILFALAVASIAGCADAPSTPKKTDTAKIGDTHGDLAGVAAALHKEDPPPPNWEYSADEDKMTDKKTLFANCQSQESLSLKFPYEGSNYGTIMIQRRRGSTDVILHIDKGQIIGEAIHARIDGGKIETYYANGPSDGDSRYAFLSPSDRLLTKLKKAKHVIIEVELYDNGIQQMEFNTAGLQWPPKEESK
jgi:hypothetical protein